MDVDFRNQIWLTYVIWAALTIAAILALFLGFYWIALVAMATFALSLVPTIFAARFDIRLPRSFVAFIVIFVFASIFLGDTLKFYDRYPWWDIILHGSASVGLGLVGFLFVFMLFEGDRYAAPPLALAVISMCFAMAFGVVWEIFEFSADQLFGLNLQKTGLVDTMWDLIVDTIGAFLGATAGYLYLKGRRFGGLVFLIRAFIQENKSFYRKHAWKRRARKDKDNK